MNALNGEEMLVAWERSRRRSDQEAALVLLAMAMPESSTEDLSTLPLAERNGLLLELRARTLGSRMDGCGHCPECGTRLEFALDARALALQLREQVPESTVELCGFVMRPTNSADLLACSAAASDAEACSMLLERTVREKVAGGAARPTPGSVLQGLPEPLVAALIEQFERLNAAAEIQVWLQCADCGARSQLDLDIAHYLVREVADAARRLLQEIHELAGAYGWSERSIVRMTRERRAIYLEMLRA
jgi:hypothetical protein